MITLCPILALLFFVFFFFKQKTAYEMRISDWSSDVCSSDLLFVWNQFVTVPEEAVAIEAVGAQWQWTFRLPGKDGALGTSNPKSVNYENPFGLRATDPNGQDDILVEDGELHLQRDKPVKVLLRSIDVLHDFYVTQFRAKMAMVPGTVTYFWLTPTTAGTYEILC